MTLSVEPRIAAADLAAVRIDFRDWLGRMNHGRRQIAETLPIHDHVVFVLPVSVSDNKIKEEQ